MAVQIDNLKVKIHSPQTVIWEGEAQWVSSVNSQGPFDILPMHSNFITIIQNQPIRIKTLEGITEHQFPSAILYTYKNSIRIYINA